MIKLFVLLLSVLQNKMKENGVMKRMILGLSLFVLQQNVMAMKQVVDRYNVTPLTEGNFRLMVETDKTNHTYHFVDMKKEVVHSIPRISMNVAENADMGVVQNANKD